MNWSTRITELLQIRYPIVQGGLAHLAYHELAAAVSNAGGLGQITAMSLKHPEQLREEIRHVREKTDHPFGVNFAIGQHGRSYREFLDVAIEEKVPVVSVTGGNPAPFFDDLQGVNVKKLVLVATIRQAKKAEELGADAVMVVGQEGGGHIGREDLSTFVLVPQVVDAVRIPVIASGGIGDGRGLMAALSLGAEGIEMGTRFIATKECVHAHESYKQALVEGDENSTIVIKRSLGAPGRALKNRWTSRIVELEKANATYETLKTFISGEANKRFANEGKVDEGFAWAGQVVGLIKDVPLVEQLIDRIIKEGEKIRKSWL
ncbi:NAD(P)H-dependent flavin oxidoreductase [Fervidibacillus albus]|uniref:Probable nitronate monooxygenase n=1 Tax=Fervidibacillus albus TaxID=2980026 RepID=A0A9E8RXF2_9BACI|nr:nitronate monooxygenase family protein [Fervidibacillus albus]WAA11103.1 nitronate monooxygenase family protein [Fervidibacillus albus]